MRLNFQVWLMTEADEVTPDLLHHAIAAITNPSVASLSSFSDHLEERNPDHVGTRLINKVLNRDMPDDEEFATPHYATSLGMVVARPHFDRRNAVGKELDDIVHSWKMDDPEVFAFEPEPNRPEPRPTTRYYSPPPIGQTWYRADGHFTGRARVTRISVEELVREVMAHGGLHNLAHLIAGLHYFHPDIGFLPEYES